jgi:hypothetical protein
VVGHFGSADAVSAEEAFTENPRIDCRIDQVQRGIAKPWGGEAEAEEGETLPQVDPDRSVTCRFST